MSVSSRLENIESKIKEESGFQLAQLRKLSDLMVKEMWFDDRLEVVKEFAFASAIYEWAAINIADDVADLLGKGESEGVFQAYRKQTIKALLRYPRLRAHLIHLTDKRYAKRNEMPHISTRVKTMEEKLIRKGSLLRREKTRIGYDPNNRKRTRRYVKRVTTDLPGPGYDFWLYRGPVVNLLGKIHLSIEKAKYAHDLPNSILWDAVPDNVLKWILLCFEGAGQVGNGDRIQNWNKYIVREVEKAKRQSIRVNLEFDFGKGAERRRKTYQTLGLDFEETCRTDDLNLKEEPRLEAAGRAG